MPAGNPGGSPGIALMGGMETGGRTMGGVPGLLDKGPEGARGGDDLPGDEAGLLRLEQLLVVTVLVMAGVVVVTMLPGLDMTKLRGDDRAISSWGSGSFSMAAKLWVISCGEACLFKWESSLSFSVKPCNYVLFKWLPIVFNACLTNRVCFRFEIQFGHLSLPTHNFRKMRGFQSWSNEEMKIIKVVLLI